MGYDPL
jgi:hypothetical protein